MKNLISFLMVALVMMVTGARMNAATGLWVSGVQVNTSNASDVLGDGTVSYDESTHTLTLNNATLTGSVLVDQNIDCISTTTKACIHVDHLAYISEFKINLIGENAITLESSWDTQNNRPHVMGGLFSRYSSFTISGPGSLEISADAGIEVAGCDLNVKDGATVTVNSDKSRKCVGIYGSSSWNSSEPRKDTDVLVDNATLKIYGNGSKPMLFIASIEVKNGFFIYPEGAHLKASDGSLLTGTNAAAGYVEIEPAPTFPLHVADVQVNEYNRGDVLGDGKVNYDPTTNTLTLNNATINCPKIGIVADIQGLHIKLLGENSIYSQRANTFGISFSESDNVVIEGGGSLTMTSVNDYMAIGLYTHKNIADPAIIRDCSIYIPNGSIQNDQNDCPLIIDNAYIHIDNGYISTPPSLTLNNCEIVKPQGGVINWSSVADANGGSWWGEIEIVPTGVMRGDVNRDGKVNVSDVTTLINMILGLVPVDETVANLNGDNHVNVSDVTTLINIILGRA